MKLKFIGIACIVLFAVLEARCQTYIFFATTTETFWDSTCTKKIRKLTKGEVMHIENLIPYKKKFLYAHCIKDGKAGFIDKSHVKMEKIYYPDSTGKDPIDIAHEEYKEPYLRIINTSHHAVLKVSLPGKHFTLKPGQKQEFVTKPGSQRFKVETPGYQPLYTNELLSPYHITEVDLFIE